MATKYYAVKKGIKTGIFMTWDECRQYVEGFSGAQYKSFTSRKEAEEFLEEKKSEVQENTPYAFVDGSYNPATGVYGYGGFLMAEGKKYLLSGSGSDEEMSSMRNVAGEVLGSMAAIERAIELGIDSLTVYYDYMGIEMWATGAWKRNKSGTIAYHDYVQSVKDVIKLTFVKVKAHSNIEGNEEADRLAKAAVGIE